METQSQSLFAALGLPPPAIGGEPPKGPARMPPAPRDRREVLGLPVPRARNLFAGMPGRPDSLRKRPAPASANQVGQPAVVHFLGGRSNLSGIPASREPGEDSGRQFAGCDGPSGTSCGSRPPPPPRAIARGDHDT